jgi:hypothetical protein
MGRIRERIRINGRKCWTLFDSGAQNSYVVPDPKEFVEFSEVLG